MTENSKFPRGTFVLCNYWIEKPSDKKESFGFVVDFMTTPNKDETVYIVQLLGGGFLQTWENNLTLASRC